MAGLSVGRIEVTVDADTGKLKAQLIKGGKEAGEAGAHAIDDELAEIGGPKLKAAITKIRGQLEKGLSGIEAEINATVKKGDVHRAAEEIEFGLEGIAAVIGVDISGLDTEAAKAKLEAAFRDIEATIEPKVDDAALAAAQAKMVGAGGGAGKGAGQAFGDGFGSGLSTRMQAIIAGVAFLTEPAAVAMEGLLGGALSLAGSAFGAMSSAVGAAVPVMLAFGGAVTAVGVGLAGVPDALSAINEGFADAAENGEEFTIFTDDIAAALAGLAPAAADFVIAFAEIRGQLADIQANVQEDLFAGLGDSLRDLSTSALPEVGWALESLATSVNGFIRGVASDFTQIGFGDLFADVRPAVDDVLEGFRNLIKTVTPFFKAATPAAKELAESFNLASGSLLRMVDSGQRTGALSDFLLSGVDSLRQWADLAGEVAEAMFLLFEGSRASGDSMVQSLSDIVERFNEWMRSAEGQTAFAEFLATSRDILVDMLPIVRAVGEAFGILTSEGSEERFGDLAQGLADLVIVVADLFVALGETNTLQTSLNLIVGMLQMLVEVLDAIPAPMLQFLGTLYITNKAFGPLISGMGTVIKNLSTMTAGFSKLGALGGSLAGAAAIGGLTLLLMGMAKGFQEDAKRAAEAAEEIRGFAEAIRSIPEDGFAPIRTEVLKNLQKEADGTRDALESLLDVPIRTWALGLADGSSNATDAIVDLLNSLGPLGTQVADALAAGEIGFKDLASIISSSDNLFKGFNTQQIRNELEAAGFSVGDVTGAIEFLIEMETEHAAAQDDVTRANQEAGKGYESLGLQAAAAAEATARNREIAGQVALFMEDQAEATNSAAGAMDELVLSRRELNDVPIGQISELEGMFIAVGEAAGKAKTAADDLKQAIDILAGGAIGFQAAGDALAQGLLELEENLKKAKEGEEGFSTSLTDMSEGALKNRASVREFVTGMGEWVVGAKEMNLSNDEIMAGFEMSRGALVALVDQFDTGALSAEEYVDQLKLTPELVETLVTQPGMIDALLNAAGLKEKSDDIPPAVTTEVEQPGMEEAQVDMQALNDAYGTVPDVIPTEITTPGMEKALNDAQKLLEKFQALDTGSWTANILTTFSTGGNRQVMALGGYAKEGFTSLAGEAGPEWARFRDGVRTLLTGPTVVPPGTLVRPAQSAELEGGASIGKQVNATINVYPQTADPRAVAAQTVNRIASLANR